MIGLPSYGIVEATKVSTYRDRAREELARNGYTVLEGGLRPDELRAYCSMLETCYAEQVGELQTAGVAVEAIKDSNVVRLPLAYHADFLKLATLPAIIDVAKAILGDAFVLLMQNGIINAPSEVHQQSSWHRDLNYQHWTSSRPLAISALVCLDAFTSINGATVVLPGSHLFAPFPSDDYARKNERSIEAPAGSIIFMDAMAFHRAGHNTSNNLRRAVNHVIGVPILSQQIDIPASLHECGQDDEFLSRYLGYRWNPKVSVSAWRKSKLKPGQ